MDKGKHEIKFKYTPPKLNLGIIISFSGIIVLIILTKFNKKIDKKR